MTKRNYVMEFFLKFFKKKNKGTDEYMAPEVIMGFEYDFQADVFSYGTFPFIKNL